MRKLGVLLLAATSMGCVEYDLSEWDQVEIFNQEPPEAVDILMVVDNSCSMEPYQANLGQHFDRFVQYLSSGTHYARGLLECEMQGRVVIQLDGMYEDSSLKHYSNAT